MALTTINIPGIGSDVVVQDRASMQSPQAQGLVAAPAFPIWYPPPAFPFNWAPGVVCPIFGNNDRGNCAQVAGIHSDQIATLAAMGVESQFNLAAILAQYTQVSGGDNGWNDINLTYQWEAFGLGGNPDARILDSTFVDQNNIDAIIASLWLFGPVVVFFTLDYKWLENFKTGYLFSLPATLDYSLGHAVVLRAWDGANFIHECWGTNGYFQPAALSYSAFVVIATFSHRWFDPATGLAPNGAHYNTLAPMWGTLTGRILPAWTGPAPPPPFIPPPPPPPPPPPAPPTAVADISVIVPARAVCIRGTGWKMFDDWHTPAVRINPQTKEVHAYKGWRQTASPLGSTIDIFLATQKVRSAWPIIGVGGNVFVLDTKHGTLIVPGGYSQA